MILEKLYEKYREIGVVCTDTRKIQTNCIFFALKGPNFNANQFAAQALEKGAMLAVVDEAEFAVDERFVLVDNALSCLQQLANHHRKQLDIPFIGITGSNGKTTTKELTYAVLSKKYRTFATRGNLNNHIGVPLSLLEITPDTEIAIIEMGANRVGDIENLCKIAEPDHGLITNIGKAHIGTFGGYENIIRGKSELYHHLIQHNGVAWINSRQDVLRNMGKRFKQPLYYPQPGDYLQCELLSADPFLVIKTASGLKIHTRLVGVYNFDNIATALCLGKYFNVEEEATKEALEAYIPENNRSQIIHKNSNTIILDAYNANPSSMEKAVENLAAMDAKHKVLILGDMYELGEDSDMEHKKLGSQVASYPFDEVYLCGELIGAALESCPRGLHFKTREELTKALTEKSFRDTLFLIKASRGMGLEKVVDHIR